MRFNYTFTVWDYGDALRLHRAQKFSRHLHFALLYRVVPVLAVGGLVLLGIYDLKVRTLGAWIGLSFLIALCWFGIMLAFMPRNQLRCGFKRSTPAGQSTISVDDECVLIEVPGISETKMLWSGFVSIAQNDKMLLLYTNKDCFLIFPISTMTLEQRAELSATIERNLARK